VDNTTHEYLIENEELLYSVFKERRVSPKQIFKFIKQHFLEEV